MCQAFLDFKEEGRAEGYAEGYAEGLTEGRAEGGFQVLYELVLQRQLPLDVAVAYSKLSVEKFNAELQAYATSSGYLS